MFAKRLAEGIYHRNHYSSAKIIIKVHAYLVLVVKLSVSGYFRAIQETG